MAAVSMEDPDGALEGAGWCATGGGAMFGKKGEQLQTLSFGKPLLLPRHCLLRLPLA
jgi:hypothetical protein